MWFSVVSSKLKENRIGADMAIVYHTACTKERMRFRISEKNLCEPLHKVPVVSYTEITQMS